MFKWCIFYVTIINKIIAFYQNEMYNISDNISDAIEIYYDN